MDASAEIKGINEFADVAATVAALTLTAN